LRDLRLRLHGTFSYFVCWASTGCTYFAVAAKPPPHPHCAECIRPGHNFCFQFTLFTLQGEKSELNQEISSLSIGRQSGRDLLAVAAIVVGQGGDALLDGQRAARGVESGAGQLGRA
jgi:hypothetical protein